MTKLVFLAFLAMAVAFGEAATITVGGTTGWTIPNNTDFYDTWEDTQNITVGDTLVFNFGQPHDVAVVTEAAYDACDISSPISISTNSPFSFTISNTSDFYFICTIGTHCARGQKLSVTDVRASSTPPTTSTPAPPPPATSTPAPPTANGPSSSTTPPPPPPPPPSSSAQSISFAFSVVAAAAAVAFFA